MKRSQEVRNGIDFIASMSKKEYHEKFLRGVARTRVFGALITFKAENISDEEKQEVREVLHDMGIPFEFMESDKELDDIAAFAAARSVSLY
ncbi:hypothetical protein IKG10_01535 [Candidatus Saccharibacteria bacterium]|nr:hypothetical protein [Candidatus Saccharibacteria bacterium]